MQLLIDKYEKEVKKTKSPTVEYLVQMVLDDIKEMELLETERQQIEEAWLDGVGAWDSEMEKEQYYKETYG